jgi:hypothetical protein
MINKRRGILPIILLFVFVNAFLLTAKNLLAKYGLDKDVLIVANIICVVINVLAFFIQSKSLQNKNPSAFVRAVMGGILLKMLVCIIAVFIYVTIAKVVNKPSIIAAMVLYILYMAIEIAAILKLNKQKNG